MFAIILISANRGALVFQITTFFLIFFNDIKNNKTIIKKYSKFLLIVSLIISATFISNHYKLNVKIQKKNLEVIKKQKLEDVYVNGITFNGLLNASNKQEEIYKKQFLNYNVDYIEFYNLKQTYKNQECRRKALLIANTKLIFSSNGLIGITNNEYQKYLKKIFKNIGCNEKIAHPHSLLFGIIFYYGTIVFIFILLPLVILIFKPLKNTNALFFLSIIFFPSGVGSLINFTWSMLISFVLAILISNKKIYD